MPDKDIIHIEENSLTFHQDSHTQQWKMRTLPTLKFLTLILQHVLPKGLHRVRDYGF
nr:transposase [Vibrio neptunius]